VNTFGRRLRLGLFGESHGEGVGCVLDGVPPGLPIDEASVQQALDRRRPGTGPLVSSRQESDRLRFLSGTIEGRATGAPLAIFIANEDVRSQDYDALRRTPRPGHSDWIAGVWARGHHDHRGGGHYSGRLTAPLVAAGAIVGPLLAHAGVTAAAHLHQVHEAAGPADAHDVATMHARATASAVHTAHVDLEAAFTDTNLAARSAKDSVGGVVEWKAEGVPAALGDPFFDSVESLLAHLLLSVPAVKGVSFGDGFAAVGKHGSKHNDAYRIVDGRVTTATNHAGGILGGRTTGAPLWGHVAVKPTSSIFQPQETVDLDEMVDATLELKGRHDPCIAVRAVPVVDACVRIVLADLLLQGIQEGHVEAPRW
jgi:chorismate synthase